MWIWMFKIQYYAKCNTPLYQKNNIFTIYRKNDLLSDYPLVLQQANFHTKSKFRWVFS